MYVASNMDRLRGGPCIGSAVARRVNWMTRVKGGAGATRVKSRVWRSPLPGCRPSRPWIPIASSLARSLAGTVATAKIYLSTAYIILTP